MEGPIEELIEGTLPQDDQVIGGLFHKSLKRNNTSIRNDRAQSISEDTSTLYKRAVEDIVLDIKRLRRQRDNMLDLSPDNALSLKHAENFNSAAFVDKDIELGLEIRLKQVKYNIALNRLKVLFGIDLGEPEKIED